MNGAHDLGGVHGLGRVELEENEPVFHSPWEKKVFAMMFGTMGNGLINLDEFRHGIERMHPVHYLSSRYYEHWLYTMEKNLTEKGIVKERELEARTRRFLKNPKASAPVGENPELTQRMLRLIREGAPTSVKVKARPRFRVGDNVAIRNFHTPGHTRLPRYARDKRGVIARVYGAYIFPDTNAHRRGENPQYVYSVRFDAHDLWGEDAEPNEFVYLDLWESYLGPASTNKEL